MLNMLIKQNLSNKSLKIVVLGSPKSGKSAVTVRYLTKRFIGEYSSSKDFLYHQTLNLNNNRLEIEILDTSDCKTNQCLIDHIKYGEAFAVIYSICDLDSFLYAKKIIEKIFTIKSIKNHTTSPPILSDDIDLLMETNNNSYKCFNNDENLDINFNNNQLPIILIGNFRDLEHNRQVIISDVEEFALKFQILFYETSAAESYISVSLAFQSLIREATQSLIRDNMQSSTSSSKLINQICNLNKDNNLTKPYCRGYLENRQLIDYSNNYFKSSNICERSNSSSSNDDKYQVVNRRKSMTVSKMIGIVFGSARQKKRPSLSI